MVVSFKLHTLRKRITNNRDVIRFLELQSAASSPRLISPKARITEIRCFMSGIGHENASLLHWNHWSQYCNSVKKLYLYSRARLFIRHFSLFSHARNSFRSHALYRWRMSRQSRSRGLGRSTFERKTSQGTVGIRSAYHEQSNGAHRGHSRSGCPKSSLPNHRLHR